MVYELIIENNIYYKIIYININKQKKYNFYSDNSILFLFIYLIKLIKNISFLNISSIPDFLKCKKKFVVLKKSEDL